MTLKEFLTVRIKLFFLLVTLILIANVLLGASFAPDTELRYYHLLSPIILAALCVLPTCVTFFKKEPTPKQYLLRLAIEWAMIEAIVLLLVSPPAGVNRPIFYVALGGSVLVIYVLAEWILWRQKVQQSKDLTAKLKKLQQAEQK